MPGILWPILRPRRRVTPAADPTPPQDAGAEDAETDTTPPARLARRLADAIDRAISVGMWDHADRSVSVRAR